MAHTDKRDPYQILNVPRDADRETIEAAYRALVRQYHPDVSHDPDATARMQDINWARETLTGLDTHLPERVENWPPVDDDRPYPDVVHRSRRRAHLFTNVTRWGCLIWLIAAAVARVVSSLSPGTSTPPAAAPPTLAVSSYEWVEIQNETDRRWAQDLLTEARYSTTAEIGGYVLELKTAPRGYYCPPGAFAPPASPELDQCNYVGLIRTPAPGLSSSG
jgi:hypothetical protein